MTNAWRFAALLALPLALAACNQSSNSGLFGGSGGGQRSGGGGQGGGGGRGGSGWEPPPDLDDEIPF